MTQFKENNSDFYDNEYFLGLEFRYFSGAHKNKIDTLFRFLGDIRGKKILDIGCGGGLFSSLLKSKGADVIGMDYSASAVAFAQDRYPDISFIKGSVYELDNLSHDFDIIVMMDVIEHLGDQKKAIQNISKLLKPGGKIVLSTDLDDTAWHNRFFDRFIWFSMRLSKEGRAYRLIKLTEAKISKRTYYQDSHIGLMDFNELEQLFEKNSIKVLKHEVYPLVKVWWRDFFFQLLPKRARGEHQMICGVKL